jgi:hypothetical protein
VWSVHACVEFEKRGVPAIVVVTDIFEVRAGQLLRSLGYPHIPVLVTRNPVVYLQRPEIQERVRDLLNGVVSSLKGAQR